MKEIINGKTWNWPAANSHELTEVNAQIEGNPTRGNDSVFWTPDPTVVFTVRSVWNEFHNIKGEVEWVELVWQKKMIPRHSIILWLAVRQRLMTKDKMMRYEIVSRATCVLCHR